MTEPTPPTTIDGDLASLATWFPVLDQPLEPWLLSELSAIAPTSIDAADCAEHARDWWPIAIGWAAGSTVPALPRCVVRPRSTAEVSAVMAFATKHHLAVTPSGGRSGVCGGSIPLHGGIALDLTGLTGEIVVDEVSLTATVGAGTFGPDFEAALNATGPGYTCGHFPQSFALSTVGGWLACRGAGQYSNRYGKIEDLVLSVTAVLPDGTVFSTNAHGPRTATGPSLTQLLVGAEGTLGIITEATLKIFEKPTAEARRAMTFATFAEGLEACRRILRQASKPSAKVAKVMARRASAVGFSKILRVASVMIPSVPSAPTKSCVKLGPVAVRGPWALVENTVPSGSTAVTESTRSSILP